MAHAWIIENPVDRGGSRASNAYYRAEWKEHAPLWLSKHMQRLRLLTTVGTVTFAQCMLGGEFQKYTTLWFSTNLQNSLGSLRDLRCTHRKQGNRPAHRGIARGYDSHGHSLSRRAGGAVPLVLAHC